MTTIANLVARMSNPNMLGEQLIIERMLDGEMTLVEIDAAPKHKKDRTVIARRVAIAPCIRVQREKLNSMAERIALRLAKTPAQNRVMGGQLHHRLPSGSQLLREIAEELGAISSGKIVRKVQKPRVRTSALTGVVTDLGTYEVIETVDSGEMLLFYDDEDAAMLALMKFG
jgi:hypothetical protein